MSNFTPNPDFSTFELGQYKPLSLFIMFQVSAGLECGIGMDDYDDWIEGDIIEAFNAVQKRRTLEEASASMSAAIEEAGV